MLVFPCRVNVIHNIDLITSDIQSALYFSFTTLVNGFTGVKASIKWSGFPNLQGQHTLFTEHAVFGIPREIHFVFVPEYLWLRNTKEEFYKRRQKMKFTASVTVLV